MVEIASGSLPHIQAAYGPEAGHLCVPTPPGVPWSTAEIEEHATVIHDLRPAASEFLLDDVGFQLLIHRSAVKNFWDEADIKRVYYLYDVPGGAARGGHGHKALHQLIIAMAGSFDVILDNGSQAEKFLLNRSYYGLHIPPMTWRELENFSSGAVCLVLASEIYDEEDYFRDYNVFLDAIREIT